MNKKIMIIGHVDHGRNVLVNAITNILAKTNSDYDVVAVTPEEMDKHRGISIIPDHHFTVPDISQIMIVEPEPFVGLPGFPIPGMLERMHDLTLPEKQDILELVPKNFTPPLTRRERRANARNLKK